MQMKEEVKENKRITCVFIGKRIIADWILHTSSCKEASALMERNHRQRPIERGKKPAPTVF